MEENTKEKRPDLMVGKKIMYVHGFGSSGASGSARGLRILLPQATVISPDLPVHPSEAMELLHHLCETERPDLIVGSSMGGMFTEMLYGFDRLLVNPAFQIADTMAEHNMMGYAIVADTKTDSPGLGNSDSGRQQDESQNNQCLSHIRPFQRNP